MANSTLKKALQLLSSSPGPESVIDRARATDRSRTLQLEAEADFELLHAVTTLAEDKLKFYVVTQNKTVADMKELLRVAARLVSNTDTLPFFSSKHALCLFIHADARAGSKSGNSVHSTDPPRTNYQP